MRKQILTVAGGALAVATFTTASADPAAAGCTIRSDGTAWCTKLVGKASPMSHSPRPTVLLQRLAVPRRR